ncbi:hypothetical protein [Shimia sp. MMG029]|uniref:hypothetical protein n=1 Tax=Shimia sp. MMG029 TaxID=3021978 RepID=UPI0022FF0870|nr:hypothetical protein [Shimia sp. MMG029]MDA5558824.1 hypothetical protein [Shimia sp. MMG029]
MAVSLYRAMKARGTTTTRSLYIPLAQISVLFVLGALYLSLIPPILAVIFPPVFLLYLASLSRYAYLVPELFFPSMALPLIMSASLFALLHLAKPSLSRMWRALVHPMIVVVSVTLSLKATEFMTQMRIEAAGKRQGAICVSSFNLQRALAHHAKDFRSPHALAVIDGHLHEYSFSNDSFGPPVFELTGTSKPEHYCG